MFFFTSLKRHALRRTGNRLGKRGSCTLSRDFLVSSVHDRPFNFVQISRVTYVQTIQIRVKRIPRCLADARFYTIYFLLIRTALISIEMILRYVIQYTSQDKLQITFTIIWISKIMFIII